MRLTLYGYWRSSASWRVRIALGLKDLQWETVPVHLVQDGGHQRQPAHLRRNPMGQVPVLEVDGHHLSQSLAIIDWLDHAVPEPALLPAAPFERAAAFALAELVNSGIQPLQNLAVLAAVDDLQAGARAAWGQRWITDGLDAYAAEASKHSGRFSVGDAVSWADICLIPQLYNARRFACDLSRWPGLLEIEARCAEIDAFERARPERQIDATP